MKYSLVQNFEIASYFRFFNLKKEYENGRTTVASAGHYGKSVSQNMVSKIAKTVTNNMPIEQRKHLPSCLT